MIKMQRIIFNTDPLEVCVENVNHWVRAYFYLIMLKSADTFHPKVIYIYIYIYIYIQNIEFILYQYHS